MARQSGKGIAFKIEGLGKLQKSLDALPAAVAKKAVRQSIREALKPLKRAVEEKAPVGKTLAIRRSVKLRAAKRARKGRIAAEVRIGQGDFSTRVKGSHRGEFGRIVVALDQTAETLRADREAINILQQRQASILESMVEGLYGTDAEGRINYVNSAAERLLGWTAAEMLGQRPHAMFHHTRADGSPYPAAECPLSGARLRQEPSAASDEVFWRKDGSSFPVDFAGSPIVAGERTVGAVVVFRDISERRTAERARQKLLSELHQRNEQLTLTEDQ